MGAWQKMSQDFLFRLLNRAPHFKDTELICLFKSDKTILFLFYMEYILLFALTSPQTLYSLQRRLHPPSSFVPPSSLIPPSKARSGRDLQCCIISQVFNITKLLDFTGFICGASNHFEVDRRNNIVWSKETFKKNIQGKICTLQEQ